MFQYKYLHLFHHLDSYLQTYLSRKWFIWARLKLWSLIKIQPFIPLTYFPGTFDADLLKHHLTEHIVNKRDRIGELMFPRIRQQLVSSWGNYAWDANVQFNIDNHFIVANGVYRGRQVGDNNIQVDNTANSCLKQHKLHYLKRATTFPQRPT